MRYQSQRHEALVTRVTFSGIQGLEVENHRLNERRKNVVARGGLIGAADWTDEHIEALADLAIGRFASRPLLRQIDLSHLADDRHRQLAVRRVQVQTVVAAERDFVVAAGQETERIVILGHSHVVDLLVDHGRS